MWPLQAGGRQDRPTLKWGQHSREEKFSCNIFCFSPDESLSIFINVDVLSIADLGHPTQIWEYVRLETDSNQKFRRLGFWVFNLILKNQMMLKTMTRVLFSWKVFYIKIPTILFSICYQILGTIWLIFFSQILMYAVVVYYYIHDLWK